MGLCTIKRSSEFQRVRGGLRAANASFVIETRLRGVSSGQGGGPAPTDGTTTGTQAAEVGGKASSRKAAECTGPRFGFTITCKIGTAVVRNRIRRRFKEALRSMPPGIILPGYDYVVVARPGVIEQPFAELSRMLATTIAGLHKAGHRGRDRQQGGTGSRGPEHVVSGAGNQKPSKPLANRLVTDGSKSSRT